MTTQTQIKTHAEEFAEAFGNRYNIQDQSLLKKLAEYHDKYYHDEYEYTPSTLVVDGYHLTVEYSLDDYGNPHIHWVWHRNSDITSFVFHWQEFTDKVYMALEEKLKCKYRD